MRTFAADPNAGGSPEGNNGWHQGTMHAPLLGLRNETAALLLGRVAGSPLPGYRFPFFSGEDGMSDFPSVEQFSNLQAGAQFALIQAGEDAADWGAPGSIVLLPGWPCSWDVSFRLRAPFNTSVTVVWANSSLQSLDVDPPARRADVLFAPGC